MDFPSFFSTFSTKSVQKRAKIGGEIKKFAPCGANFRGVLKMEHGEALVLVDTIERPEEIDLHPQRQLAGDDGEHDILVLRHQAVYAVDARHGE